MAQGRSTKRISMMQWNRTSRLLIQNSLYGGEVELSDSLIACLSFNNLMTQVSYRTWSQGRRRGRDGAKEFKLIWREAGPPNHQDY